MELRFGNGDSISKSSFDFKIKSSFDFEIELRFQNRAISKWSFDFDLKVFHVTFCTEKRHVI